MALRAPTIRVIPRALAAAALASAIVFPLATWVLRAHVERAATAALVTNATMGAETVRDRVDELRALLERTAPTCARRLLDDPPQSPRLERMLESLLAEAPRLAALAVAGPDGRLRFVVAPDADGFDPLAWFLRGAPRRAPLAERADDGTTTRLWLPLAVDADAGVRVIGIVDARQLLPRTSPTHDGEAMRLVLPTATVHTTRRAPGADLRLELDDHAEFAALRVELPSGPRAIERMFAATTLPLVALGALLVCSFALATRWCIGARVRASSNRPVSARRVWVGPRVEPSTPSHEPPRRESIVLRAALPEVADCEHALPARVGEDDPDHEA